MDIKPENLSDWTPARFFQNGDGAFVDWIFLGKDRFIHPFFNDTIELRLREPFSQLFKHVTPIDFLGELYEKCECAKPRGFIFHISRCGSTLVAQMLASLSKNIVISEAAVLDNVIRANASNENKIAWMRWMVSALARKRFADEENLFIKFDNWSVLDLPLIKAAFPDVPWIFLYRDPVEVIVSNVRQPGVHMIPAAIEKIFPNMTVFEVLQFTMEERYARTIAAFCKAGLENKDSKLGKFINYKQLPGAVTNEICEHFGVKFCDEDIGIMKSVTDFNAKTPYETFSADSEQKQREASEAVVHFAHEFVSPFYEKLENLR